MSVVLAEPTATIPTNRAPTLGRLREGHLAAMAFALTFLGSVVQVPADPDLWGHLRFGLTHLETGHLADTDPYSYTAAGQPWVNHEWLTEWLFGGSYSLWGPAGLVALRAFLLLACVGALWPLIRRHHVAPSLSLAWGLFAFVVLTEFFRVRPQMFTYAFMAGLLWICDRDPWGRGGWIWTIPLGIVAWTNLHAGFVAGLGVFGIHWCCWVWRARLLPDRCRVWTRLAALLLVTLAATCVNPYGWQYWKFVLFAVTLPRPAVTEWQPIVQQNGVVMFCYLWAVLVPALCWLRSSRRGHAAETLTFVAGVVLAWQHTRHFPFLLLFGTVLLARRAPECLALRQRASRPHHHRNAWRLMPALLILVAALAGGTNRLIHQSHLAVRSGPLTVPTDCYPVRAVEFLSRNRIDGKLDSGFNWGEYCLFKLYPRCTVFCDGRYETVYPDAVTRLAMHEGHDPTIWRERLDAFGTDVVLTGLEDPFGQWVAVQEDFAEIYRDDTARVLVRRCERHEPLLRRHAMGELEIPAPPGEQVRFPA